MNTSDIKQLYIYNTWANERIFEVVSQLTSEQYVQDLKSSHRGIHGTLVHIIGAQKIWLSRWLGNPDKTLIKADTISSLAELKTIWEEVNEATMKFLDTLSDEKLQETLAVQTITSGAFVNTYQEMLTHLVNHSSYHRGQIITMLRQLGVKPVSTDMIVFYREKK
jgi:uncharacterized damage-inducible protein DinB